MYYDKIRIEIEFKFSFKIFFEKINSKTFSKKKKFKRRECDKIGNLKYSTWYINAFSLILTIFIMAVINICHIDLEIPSQKAVLKAGFSVNTEKQENMVVTHTEAITKEENNDWYLEIPKINLKAPIEEGTTKEIMDQFIGHFEESKTWIGNVCLAAHNRGYEKNYFAEVKHLVQGDTILYFYQGEQKTYIVEKNDIIQDTDLTCLENTEENSLTLITCVENEPNYRRCVKAVEKKE